MSVNIYLALSITCLCMSISLAIGYAMGRKDGKDEERNRTQQGNNHD